MKFAWPPDGQSRAFTLLELLVTLAVMTVFVLMLLSVTDNTFRLWRSTHSSIAMFDEARGAFDVLTHRLSQATVNTYLDYYDKNWNRRGVGGGSSFIPAYYGRTSDLHFLSGNANALLGGTTHPGHGVFFFAALGYTGTSSSISDLPNLLVPCGDYLEWGDDRAYQPTFLRNAGFPSHYRLRLIENTQPSQDFHGYPAFTDVDPNNDRDWVNGSDGMLKKGNAHVLAENIIALVIRPEVPQQDAQSLGLPGPEALTTDYLYDTRSVAGQTRSTPTSAVQFAQLPPMLRIVMVAVDEASAARLIQGSALPAAFDTSALFRDPTETQYQADLASVEKQLVGARVRFRFFAQVIALRGAKFSAQKETH